MFENGEIFNTPLLRKSHLIRNHVTMKLIKFIRILTILLLTLTTLFLFACSTDAPLEAYEVYETDNVYTVDQEIYVPEEPDISDSFEHMPDGTIIFNDVAYIFDGREIDEAHIVRTDIVLQYINRYFSPARTPPTVVFTTDERAEINLDEVRINPDYPRSLGAAFRLVLTGDSRPAWLSAGLELYISVNQDISQFEVDDDPSAALSRFPYALGNEWFVHNFFNYDYEKQRDALTLLYHFIGYLSENDMLNELLNLYIANSSAADEMFASAWYDFSGLSVNEVITHQYRFDYYLNEFTVRTDRGYYTFLRTESWDEEIVARFVEEMDISIAFTYNFLGFEQAAPIPVTLDPCYESQLGGWANGDMIMIYAALHEFALENPSFPSFITSHETVHHIQLNHIARSRSFEYYMMEGMASAVATLLFNEMEVSDESMMRVVEERGDRLIYFISTASGEQSICVANFVYYSNKFSALLHLVYMEENNRFNDDIFLWPGPRPINPFYNQSPDAILNCYATATSFVLFLFELGSLEDFLVFYADRDAAYDIYGMELYDLIDKWLHEYLEIDIWREFISESWIEMLAEMAE